MTKLTKEEQIQAIYDLKVGYTLGHADIAILKSMTRQLLASMEQEPVAQVYQPANIGICAPLGPSVMMLKPLSAGTKLYAAPQLPQPAVVDADDNFYSWFGREWHENYQHNQYTAAAKQMLGVMAESAWRAGRSAAMLQGAEPVSHPYTLREGWVAVPVDMTPEQMRAVQRDSSLGTFASAHLSGAYDMYREFWDVAIAAAPQQEVHFKTTSDERLMKTPDITGETVKVIGSFNDDVFCHKHPDTPRLKHPYMQLMVYPPRPATYCPKCEPHVAEWEDRDKKLRKGKGVK